MANYASIKITYKGNNIWGFTDNTMPSNKYRGANKNSATIDQDLVTFNTKTGGNIYNRQPYSIFTYVDETDSDNDFTPTSAIGLITQLEVLGFFGSSDGGGGDIVAFTDLSDTFPNKFGRALQVLRVNADETLIESFEFVQIEASTDLIDMPTVLTPFLFLRVNEFGTGYELVDPNLYVNPVRDFGMTLFAKGYHWELLSGIWVALVNNLETEEIGDYFSGALYKNPSDASEGVITIPLARWNGGDKLDINSYAFNYSEKIAFDGEPDCEE